MHRIIFIPASIWVHATYNRSLYPLNEYPFKDVFIISAITEEGIISKGFRVFSWRHNLQLCKAEDLPMHFGDNLVCGVSFQAIIDHFIIAIQYSLLSPSIRL